MSLGIKQKIYHLGVISIEMIYTAKIAKWKKKKNQTLLI